MGLATFVAAYSLAIQRPIRPKFIFSEHVLRDGHLHRIERVDLKLKTVRHFLLNKCF